MQTKLGSFIEAWGNVAIGFGVNFTANLLILPLFGFTNLTVKKNLEIGVLFTVVSVARSYAIRRLFNTIKGKWNQGAKELELGKDKEIGISEWIGREDRRAVGDCGHTIHLRNHNSVIRYVAKGRELWGVWCDKCGAESQLQTGLLPFQWGTY